MSIVILVADMLVLLMQVGWGFPRFVPTQSACVPVLVVTFWVFSGRGP